MDFQEKINKAWELKNDGNSSEAMSLYSELYEQLIKDAFRNTGNPTDSYLEDEVRVGNYLKGDNLACTILNNMAVILAENGEKESARKYFNESIKYTPEYLDYQNPVIGLKELE